MNPVIIDEYDADKSLHPTAPPVKHITTLSTTSSTYDTELDGTINSMGVNTDSTDVNTDSTDVNTDSTIGSSDTSTDVSINSSVSANTNGIDNTNGIVNANGIVNTNGIDNDADSAITSLYSSSDGNVAYYPTTREPNVQSRYTVIERALTIPTSVVMNSSVNNDDQIDTKPPQKNKKVKWYCFTMCCK